MWAAGIKPGHTESFLEGMIGMTMVEIHRPKNTFMINELYAYVSVDAENGFEGVIGLPMGSLGLVPAVGADRARMLSLKPAITILAKQLKITVRLVRFSTKEVLETFHGQES
jgi:hypothetical protein